MTGPDAPFGDKFKKAYSMAGGGDQRRRWREREEDRGGDRGSHGEERLAATVAEKLITQEKVLDRSPAGAPRARPWRSPPWPSASRRPTWLDHLRGHDHHQGFEWVFRNNPTGSIYPAAFNNFITEYPNAMPKSAAVVYDNTLFGKTIGTAAMKFLKSKGVPIVADEAYPVNTLDFKPIMTKVKGTQPRLPARWWRWPPRMPSWSPATPRRSASLRAPSWASAAASAWPTSPPSSGPGGERLLGPPPGRATPTIPRTKAFYDKFDAKYGIWPHEHEGGGLRRHRHHRRRAEAGEAHRQPGGRPGGDPQGAARHRTWSTVFGKVKFGNRTWPDRRPLHEPERRTAGATRSCAAQRQGRAAPQRVAEQGGPAETERRVPRFRA